MKDTKRFIVVLFVGLLIFGSYSTAMAEQRIEIESQSIKALVEEVVNSFPTITEGDYVTISWTVKLRNNSDEPLTRDITLTFMDDGNAKLDKTTVTSKLDAGSSTTVSDNLRIRRTIAKRIASGYVSVVQ